MIASFCSSGNDTRRTAQRLWGIRVRHALQTAYEASGIRRTVLHATEPGYPLYLGLGYHPTAKFMGCKLQS